MALARTVLQRRLASSLNAIFSSLKKRQRRFANLLEELDEQLLMIQNPAKKLVGDAKEIKQVTRYLIGAEALMRSNTSRLSLKHYY